MFDRRMVTDVGLAFLIAFPATLPAAPSPWSTDQEAGQSLQRSGALVSADRDHAHGALAPAPRDQGNS